MGIDISNKLMVGASYDELGEFFEKIIELGDTDGHAACEDASDVIECYFEYASPTYDSPHDEWFIGFRLPNYSRVDEEWWLEVKETAHQFELLTGVKPRIRGGAHVY
jgi:hypothetical protein